MRTGRQRCGDGADEQVGLADDPVGLQDFGDAGWRGGDVVGAALSDLGGDVGGERVPEDRRRDLAFE